jgi:hypothetical protein
MFETRALAEGEELGSNILHLNAPWRLVSLEKSFHGWLNPIYADALNTNRMCSVSGKVLRVCRPALAGAAQRCSRRVDVSGLALPCAGARSSQRPPLPRHVISDRRLSLVSPALSIVTRLRCALVRAN